MKNSSAQNDEMIHEVLISLENRHGKDALIRVRRVVEIWRGRAKRVRPSDIMQKPQLYFPDLSANAWHDPAQFPFVKNLEESAPQIRSELEHVLMDSIAFEPYHQQKLIGITDGNWNAYHFRRAQSWLANSVEKCPTTFSALQQVSRSAGTAMFSAVSPGGHIAPHCGPWNCRLTFHLGLAIPAESEMRVGTEMRSWREGKCLAFDDSFEHEVWNRSGSARYILLFDIWHPDLSDIEIRFLEAIQQTLHAAEF